MRAEDFMPHDEIRSHGAIGNRQGWYVPNVAFRDARDEPVGDKAATA